MLCKTFLDLIIEVICYFSEQVYFNLTPNQLISRIAQGYASLKSYLWISLFEFLFQENHIF